MNSTAELEKHQQPSASWGKSERTRNFASVSNSIFIILMSYHTAFWIQNLAPESEPREEAGQIWVKVPAKDAQHLLKQLHTKLAGQEVVWDACQYYQLSVSDAWTGWVMCADLHHHDQQIKYCIGSPQVKEDKEDQTWVGNRTMTGTCYLSTTTGMICSFLPRTEETGVLWLPHVSQDMGTTKLN